MSERPADAASATLPSPLPGAQAAAATPPPPGAVSSLSDTIPAELQPGLTIGRKGRGPSATSPEAATVRGTQASIKFREGSGGRPALRGGGAPESEGASASGVVATVPAAGRPASPTGGSDASSGRPSVRLGPGGAPGYRDANGAPTFEVLRTLGQGGMGVVYAAAQESLRREVALKMIRPDVEAEADTERRFVDEALTTARLDHPNVVSVYDLGRDPAGNLFIAMKLVRGVSWQSLVAPRHGDSEETKARAKAMGLRDHLEILLKVCDAVAFAHSRDVIHRDLKPENVMVGAFGEVLVMDWGLALDVSGVARAARGNASEAPCGTPCFMSPELVRGDLPAQGPPTDVYLLGGIVYRLITGTAPHPGTTVAAAIAAALKGDVEPAAERAKAHGRTVPLALAEIAAKALAADPAKRHATAGELAAAVRAFMHNEGAVKLAQAALEQLDVVEKRMALADSARAARLGARASQSAGESGEVAVKDEPHGAAGTYASLAVVAAELGQSLQMWPANKDAERGLARARLTTARYALFRGDLGVTDSLLSLVADGTEGKAALVSRLAAERTARAAVRRRRAFLLALVGVVAIGLGIFAWREAGRAKTAEAARARRAEAVHVVEGFYWESTEQRIDAYERAIRIDPTWAEGHMEAAWALMSLAYDRAITAPRAARVHLDFALGHFDEAIKLVPDDGSKIAERGYVHETRGEFEEALRDYRRAVELEPGSALGLSCKGSLLAYEGDLPGAEKALTNSILLRRYASSVLLRGLVRLGLGDLDGASADVVEYRRANNEDEWGPSFAALVLIARGRDREASAELLPALRSFPRAPHALPLLAAIGARRGDPERARRLYERARESQVLYRPVYGCFEVLWGALRKSKDPKLARLGRILLCEEPVESLLSEVPAAPVPPMRARAAARLASGDREGALADATLAIADDPVDGEALLLRARALVRLGRVLAAEEDLVVVGLVAPERAAEIEEVRKEAGREGAAGGK